MTKQEAVKAWSAGFNMIPEQFVSAAMWYNCDYDEYLSPALGCTVDILQHEYAGCTGVITDVLSEDWYTVHIIGYGEKEQVLYLSSNSFDVCETNRLPQNAYCFTFGSEYDIKWASLDENTRKIYELGFLIYTIYLDENNCETVYVSGVVNDDAFDELLEKLYDIRGLKWHEEATVSER